MVAETAVQNGPDPNTFPNYVLANMHIGDDVVDFLKKSVDNSPEEGRVAIQNTDQGQESTIADIRRSQVYRARPENEWVGIFQGIGALIEQVNKEQFGFNLIGIEALQIARYRAEDLGHYDWHMDSSFPNNRRKLSLTIQLSDENDYEGGDLELFTSEPAQKASRQKLSAVIFPSYTLHRVTPVTKGTRYSLVAWVRGERWR